MTTFCHKKGFTLIELIVVIAILGILAAVLVPSIANYVKKANMSAAKSNGSVVLSACERITTLIQTGDSIELTAETIKAECGISVIEGTQAQDDAIVILIIGNHVVNIWSMKGGQLAAWIRNGGWTEYAGSDIEETEVIVGGTSGLIVSNGIVTGYTGSDTDLVIPSYYNGQPVIGIADNAIGNKPITSVTIGNGLTFIGASAFTNCSQLKTVTLPTTLTSLGDSAFNRCTKLISINFPASLISIPDNVCYNCTSLASVSIPEGIRSIGSMAFYGCTNLSAVTLPVSLTTINDSAFYQCSALSSVTVLRSAGRGITALASDNVFGKTNSELAIHVPSDSVEAYKTASNWNIYATKIS